MIKTTNTSARGKPYQIAGEHLNNEVDVLDTSKLAICLNFHKTYLFLEVYKMN